MPVRLTKKKHERQEISNGVAFLAFWVFCVEQTNLYDFSNRGTCISGMTTKI